MTDTRWQVHDLPEPEVLAALGRVAARHGFLNHVLIRTLKTLEGLTIEEADRRFARWGNARLRDIVEARVRRRLGAEAPATLEFIGLLSEAQRVTEDRNLVVHGLWARDIDSDERMVIDGGTQSAPPTPEQLDRLADAILQVASAINHARLDGFLQRALGNQPAMTPTARPAGPG